MNKNEILRCFAVLPLFAGTDEQMLADMIQRDTALVEQTAKGERINTDNGRALGILLSGKATISSADDGTHVILRTLRAGEIFGAAALFLDGEAPLSHIVAEEPCTTLLLPDTLVRELMARSPAFLSAYLTFLAGRVQFLGRRIRCFTAGSAERRVALFLADETESDSTVTVSLKALADTLAIGRASLYRALDKLESDGLIRHDGRRITLLSREKLLEIYQ